MVCAAGAGRWRQPFPSQPVARIKAKLLAFDGHVMTLQPLTAPVADAPKRSPVKHGHAAPANEAPSPPADAKPADAAPPANLTVAVLPDTRYVTAAPSPWTHQARRFCRRRGYRHRHHVEGQSVLAMPEALKGTGEGRFPDGRLTGRMIDQRPRDGRERQFPDPALSRLGDRNGRRVCEGRAPPRGLASPLACSADAVVMLRPAPRCGRW